MFRANADVNVSSSSYLPSSSREEVNDDSAERVLGVLSCRPRSDKNRGSPRSGCLKY